MPSRSSLALNFSILAGAAWLLIAAQLFAQYWMASADSLFDSDDAMRLVEVRSLLAGHGWFNLHEARIDPPTGYDSHWSRLIDAGLAGLFLLFNLVVDNAMAERLMRAVWPVLWILPALIGTSAMAWRIAGRHAARIVLAFAVIGLPAFHQFTPGRIDHHNVQIALSILVLAATMWSDRKLWAAGAAGALTGVALAIGFESLPYLVLAAGALAMRYMLDRTAMPALRAYGFSVAASGSAAFLLSVGSDRWLNTACDAIAINSAAPVAIGGLVIGCGASLLTVESRLMRSAVVMMSAAAALFAFVLIEPQCLGGPYGMMAPEARALWLASVPEMRSFFSVARESPVFGAWMATFPLLALLCASLLAQDRQQRRDFAVLVNTVGLCIAVVLTVLMIKGFSYGIWLGMPLVAVWTLRLFAFLRLTSLPARALTIFLLAPLTLSLTASTIAHATTTAGGAFGGKRDCFRIANYKTLAWLPAGTVATNILDYAPHILALTRHAVMAAPYHRVSSAILAEYRAFMSSPEEARRIFARSHVNYVAVCGERGPVGADEVVLQAGLWGALRAGAAPDWLAPVAEARGQAFTIYRVRP